MAKVQLRFAVKALPWHPWINDEDAANFKRVTSEPYDSIIRNWMATDTLPLTPPTRHTDPKCFPGWQGAVTVCKGRAIAELLKTEISMLDCPRMVVWTGTNTLRQWFLGRDSVLTARHAVTVYGGQKFESFQQKYTRWTRSKRTILIAHRGVLSQPQHTAACDTGVAPEIIFPEPLWNIDEAVAAIRCHLRNPLFDVAHIRFLAIANTIDEELAHYLCKKTSARFA